MDTKKQIDRYHDVLRKAEDDYDMYGAKFISHPNEDMIELKLYTTDLRYFDMSRGEKKTTPSIYLKDDILVQYMSYGGVDDCTDCRCMSRKCDCYPCTPHEDLNKFKYFEGKGEVYESAKVSLIPCSRHGIVKTMSVSYTLTTSEDGRDYYQILCNSSVKLWLDIARPYYEGHIQTRYRGFDYVEVATLQYEGAECLPCTKTVEMLDAAKITEVDDLIYNKTSAIPYYHNKKGKPVLIRDEQGGLSYICILCGNMLRNTDTFPKEKVAYAINKDRMMKLELLLMSA